MTFILGCGSIGSLIATSLKQVSKSEVILLFHNRTKLEKFVKSGSVLKVNSTNTKELFENQFKATSIQDLASKYRSSETVFNKLGLSKNLSRFDNIQNKDDLKNPFYIDNLIVTTKAHQTIDALLSILHLINSKTNIVFIQNGAGVVESFQNEVLSAHEHIYADSGAPKLYHGIITHGVYADNEDFLFNHVNKGSGNIRLGSIVVDQPAQPLPEIIDDLVSTNLNVSYMEDSLQFKLTYYEKLIVNSVINPLTTIFQCRNGELFHMTRIRKIIGELVQEDSRILQKYLLQQSQWSSAQQRIIRNYLNPEKLLRVILNVMQLTSSNYSSMLQDLMANRKSLEIYYLNGFFMKISDGRAPMNKLITDLVQSKLDLNEHNHGTMHLKNNL